MTLTEDQVPKVGGGEDLETHSCCLSMLLVEVGSGCQAVLLWHSHHSDGEITWGCLSGREDQRVGKVLVCGSDPEVLR